MIQVNLFTKQNAVDCHNQLKAEAGEKPDGKPRYLTEPPLKQFSFHVQLKSPCSQKSFLSSLMTRSHSRGFLSLLHPVALPYVMSCPE